ncbi:MAG: hypothetical protein ACJA2S_005356 [Cyclobacteriaceae bacterium]|jgi:hypothetical protein
MKSENSYNAIIKLNQLSLIWLKNLSLGLIELLVTIIVTPIYIYMLKRV